MASDPNSPRRRTLHLDVAHALGLRIVDGDLRPGSSLPNEATLGAELGVSRTVVREAMKVLASKALVEVRPRTGTRVRPRDEWHALDPDVLTWQFSGASAERSLGDLLEMRMLVEPAAARLAAKRARRADLAEIRLAYEEMERAEGNPEASVKPDLRFHMAILGATYNAFMRSFGALTQAAMQASFRLTSTRTPAYQRSLRQHRLVAEAIRARDPGGAESAMRDLLERTSTDLKATVQPRKEKVSHS